MISGGRQAKSSLALGVLGLSVVAVSGCNDEVSLGDFAGARQGTENTIAPLPACGDPGEVGPVNSRGAGVGVTLPYTDWAFATPFDTLEWDVRLEVVPPNDGYLWAHNFTFESGGTALFAFQANGGYQADPPLGSTQITHIVQFWVGGPPLAAELGDITYPDARVYAQTERNIDWWTINARYDFVPCRAYRVRVVREATATGGGHWVSARLRDLELGTEVLVGRVLAPEAWGRLSGPTSSFSNRIGWAPLTTCASPEAAAALFGMPVANERSLLPLSRTHRFEGLACPTSRMTNFAGAVRHELGQLL